MMIMKNLSMFVVLTTSAFDLSDAFLLVSGGRSVYNKNLNILSMSSVESPSLPYFVNNIDDEGTLRDRVRVVSQTTDETTFSTRARKTSTSNNKKKKKTVNNSKHVEGIFSPIVYVTRAIIGKENLNKIRGKAIAMHSSKINEFVDYHASDDEDTLFSVLFGLVDTNKDGTVSADELKRAVGVMGFSWLLEEDDEKKIHGILKRADTNQDGVVDHDEFVKEAPKTLKKNLTKLAKKNGSDMGLLV